MYLLNTCTVYCLNLTYFIKIGFIMNSKYIYSNIVIYSTEILNCLIFWPKENEYDFEMFGPKGSHIFKDIFDACVNKIISKFIIKNVCL